MSQVERVWVVDDDQSIRWVLSRALEAAGMKVQSFETAESLLAALDEQRPDAIVTDMRMPGLDGVGLLEQVTRLEPGMPVIIMTAYSDLDSAVSAYSAGAFEYLPKPFDVDDAVGLVRRAIHNRPGINGAKQDDSAVSPEILGSAPAMQEVFRAVGKLSRSNMTVLITGESGTGKELVARALHDNGPRRRSPFIALNTAAIPAELLESELFGHERGAFTGAESRRQGRFEQADGGTLFLDEIGDMPAYLQTRLLRVLSDGEFYRVGGHVPLKVDVRTIAATHQPLDARVQSGEFREDLFHRLNVIRVRIPPLRERAGDVSELASHFLQTAAAEIGEMPKSLTPATARVLAGLGWPGNVRQLENTCRWLTVMAPGREIKPTDLPPELLDSDTHRDESHWSNVLARWAEQRLASGAGAILEDALPEFERALIRAAMQQADGKRQEAARLLGWGRNTLTRKMRGLSMQ